MKQILVTGGAGYIGSHTILKLLEHNIEIIVIDNFSNSSKICLERVSALTKKKFDFFNLDIRDKENMANIFKKYEIDSVIHFAGLKSVAESIQNPDLYYQNNIFGTNCLLDVMTDHGVEKIIFSSSATVYGKEADIPYKENMKCGTPSSPYGQTKIEIEKLIEERHSQNNNFKAISLRYFNPIGAHPSGKIGEDPYDLPNNLLPFLSQVAVGKLKKLTVFGNDYPTKDGTCRRDFIHIMDLAGGHLAALKYLNSEKFKGTEIFNLGTGSAKSVLEIINEFIRVTGIKIPYEFSNRRDGDLPEFWADCSKANKILDWQCKYDLTQMIEDTWRWQSNNPKGYGQI